MTTACECGRRHVLDGISDEGGRRGKPTSMSAIHRNFILVVVAVVLLLSSLIALIGILAILPRALDEFLLTDEEYCHISIPTELNVDSGARLFEECSSSGEISFQWNSENCAIDDATSHNDISSDDNTRDTLQHEEHKQQHATKFQRITNSILWRISLHLWSQSENESDASASTEIPHLLHGNNHDGRHGNDNIIGRTRYYLHPMCDGYRKLRSRIRFEQLAYPWTWYIKSSIRMSNLTLHSLKSNVAFVSRQSSNPHWMRWKVGWSGIPGRNWTSLSTLESDGEQADIPFYYTSHLPPSMEIETLDISIQSIWMRPVISAQLHGIVINFIVQSGEFVLPLTRSLNHDHGNKASNNTAFLVGDMTLHEVLEILPKPPKVEGLYPRIGLVNITNVTLCLYENKYNHNAGASSLKVLMKIRVPNKFFLPISNLTHAHRQTGIDRKHFQKMMESSISDAFRRHLLREAHAAFRNSWISAHKAQEQLQQLVIQTQELYLDKWLEMGVNAWRQVIEHGTVPILRAIDDWASDLREIVSEPVPPLMVVLSHYWNRTLDGMNRHGIDIDKQLWGHINDMVTNVNNFHREKRLSKHLSDLREAVDGFIAKSGQDFDLLVKSCELEVKDMWLAWHRQFLPEL